ncbi:MAG: hypothetical protein HYT80_11360 [Euryarchaeota archaeon]|nr:hypothetical protein [Euryarchaeota archaeon]
MQAMQKMKHASANTKALILGDGEGFFNHFKNEIDRLLDDLRKLDDAAWKIILSMKARVYGVLDMLAATGKTTNSKELAELRRAWKRVSSSGRALARDMQRTAQQVQNRRSRN